jgi:putative peptide zinc metalloprotease protein
MAEAFLSSEWHRVAGLRTRLHVHAEVSRHRSRGQVWYAVRNAASGTVYRFNPAAYLFIGMLDGVRTVAEAWTIVADRQEEDAPTQDEVIRLLAQLHEADLLVSDFNPDFAELSQRRRSRSWSLFWQHIGNPMAVRLPLWDPDRFLSRSLWLLAPLPGLPAFLIWCAVVFPAIVLWGLHWGELTEGISDRLFAAETLWLIALVFPVVKALHEMGHAVVLKACGGPVHEMGIMLLVLLPFPYVDASSSSAFRSRWRRIGVAAAGMLVETFIAALAMYVWVLVEPGRVRAVAFVVMVVAGISTVIFNGNPLLRYDSYFILSDLLEIPNLANRASRYWGYLMRRFVLGSRDPAPATAAGEAKWLIVYAPASYACRVVVMTTIVLVIAGRFFFIGVAIAAWTVAVTIFWPVARGLGRVMTDQALAPNRLRVISTIAAGFAMLALLVGVVPMPLHTVAEGVVWLPEESIVRSETDGFLHEVAAEPGGIVSPGQLLTVSTDPDLDAEIKADRARVAALQAQYLAQQLDDKVQGALTQRKLEVEQSVLARADERAAGLMSYSATTGRFVVPRVEDLRGRYHKRGDVLGFVLPQDLNIARVIVSQGDVDLVRKRLVGAEVLVASNLGHPYPAKLLREVPAASDQLPSKALTIEGGGSQAEDLRDQNHPRTLSRYFQFDVAIPPDAATGAASAHVWVRFDHGTEPLAWQAWRRLRQLLLSRFDE